MANNSYLAQVATDLGATTQLDPDISRRLIRIGIKKNRFVRLLSRLSPESKKQMDFQVQRHWDMRREYKVTAASSAASDITLDTTDGFVAGNRLIIVDPKGRPYDFTAKVTTTPSIGATSLDVSADRPHVGTDTTIEVGSTVKRLARIIGEGGAPADVRIRAREFETQYLSHFTRSVEMTLISRKVAYRGLSEELRIEEQQMLEFNRDFNSHLMFSRAKKATTSGANEWDTEGMYWHALNWNVHEANGSLSWGAFVGFMQRLMKYGGPGNKIIFCSQHLAEQLSLWPILFNTARNDLSSKSFGFETNEFSFPANEGKARVEVDQEMESLNEMLVVDMRELRIAELQNFTGLKVDRGPAGYGIQTVGTFKFKWQMSRIAGLEAGMPQASGVIRNVDQIVR